jgi:hypothetical protein
VPPTIRDAITERVARLEDCYGEAGEIWAVG